MLAKIVIEEYIWMMVKPNAIIATAQTLNILQGEVIFYYIQIIMILYHILAIIEIFIQLQVHAKVECV